MRLEVYFTHKQFKILRFVVYIIYIVGYVAKIKFLMSRINTSQSSFKSYDSEIYICVLDISE